jgi:hypothetical protein
MDLSKGLNVQEQISKDVTKYIQQRFINNTKSAIEKDRQKNSMKFINNEIRPYKQKTKIK